MRSLMILPAKIAVKITEILSKIMQTLQATMKIYIHN